jgi:hypothetical protein
MWQAEDADYGRVQRLGRDKSSEGTLRKKEIVD